MNHKILFPFALALLLSACGGTAPAPDAEPPLAGARIGGPFTLVGSQGQPVRDSDFAGRWRIVYFGYTFCPDVCPVDMRNIGAGLTAFAKTDAARAEKVVPIFITIDPARDTPAVVGEYVANFHPRAVGLTGSQEAIDAALKAYAGFAAKRETGNPDAYLMDHSRIAYLMDPEGRPIALVPAEESAEAVAATLARWVS
ncbi:SCO family protein [Sphingomonas baiyangensis]|uniref:SCO family protein n=1 Tax=Sphingomonas baiyangensis TaxID=2572576 RepID=A0A4U1L6E7_9SPHN|nr:SCO family protein [Sphingomonas baiyangensis]TKD51913.1 SCO family protein [Sphingomonas baiyangensis]